MKSTVTFYLELTNYDNDDVAEALNYVHVNMPQPYRVLVKNQKRILLNGKEQKNVNKFNEILYKRAFSGKNVTVFLEKELIWIHRQGKHLLILKDMYEFSIVLNIHVHTNFTFMDIIKINTDQIRIFNELGIEIKLDLVHSEKISRR